jgi:hypothetical protein
MNNFEIELPAFHSLSIQGNQTQTDSKDGLGFKGFYLRDASVGTNRPENRQIPNGAKLGV